MSVPDNDVFGDGGNSVTGDNLNTFIQGCTFVSNLRGFIGLNDMQVNLLGFSSPGDGGEGEFYYSIASTATDDSGITTVKPSAAGTTGRWIRVTPISSITKPILSTVASGANTIVLTDVSGQQPASAYSNYLIFVWQQNGNSSGSVTLNYDNLGARPLYTQALVQATTGDLMDGVTYEAIYNSSLNGSNGGFQLSSPATSSFVTLSGTQSLTNKTMIAARSSIVTATSAYTVLSTDDTVLMDATSGAFSAALPTAASSTGRRLIFKKIDSSVNAATLDGNGSETIDGALTYAMYAQYEEVEVECNGTAWYIIGASAAGGTYTPVLTNGANVAASTTTVANWIKNRNYVTVWGSNTVDPTGTGTLTTLGVSLPIASNFTHTYDLAGTSSQTDISGGGTTQSFGILGDTSNHRATFNGTPNDVASRAYTYSFTYLIV